MTEGDEVAPEYVAARGVLLDALTALEEHLDSLVLVGAQAVYHHAGETDLNVPLMTTDADLAINASDLAGVPEIGGVLRSAGFVPGLNPGHWVAVSDVAVDLMVVPHQAGAPKATSRAARLSPHEKATARIARGLEPALIDNEYVEIRSLDPADGRAFSLRVAGPAALVTAKMIKIGERMDQADTKPDRLKQKDALDIFRILQAIETDELVAGFGRHGADPHARGVTSEALALLDAHAGSAGARVCQLAEDAALGDPTVAPSFAFFVRQLLDAL